MPLDEKLNDRPSGVGVANRSFIISQIDPATGTVYGMTNTQLETMLQDFLPLSGTFWDGLDRYVTLGANTSLNISSALVFGILLVFQDGTGSRTLSINGTPITINSAPNSLTAISFLRKGSQYYFQPNQSWIVGGGGGGGDITPPTVINATVLDSTHIQLVFSESVNGTAAGHSFKKGVTNLGISLMTGSGTNTFVFTLNTPIAPGDTITRSYDSATGNTLDGSGNELVSYTDQPVTNGLGGTTLNAPGSFAPGTPTSTSIPLSWADTNTSPNEVNFELRFNTINNQGSSTLYSNPVQNATTANVTGLAPANTYYFWLIAKGNGSTILDSVAASCSGTTAAGAITRRTFGGYLSRWEVPTNPDDTSKITVRTAGSDKFLIRLKDDKHSILSTWDLKQIDDNALQPKHVVSGINGRPALEFQIGNKAYTTFPGANGLGFPCEIGMIIQIPAYPAAITYFSMCNSGALDAALTPAGELLIYSNPAADFIHTGITLALNTPVHFVRKRLANGDTSIWVNNGTPVTQAAYGSATVLTLLMMGGDGASSGSSAGFHMFMSELWVSGSDNGGAPVLPTDAERTTLYNDAKIDFTSLP
jgi:hypothetical protein